ncbi:sensor histidine kinase [Bacillaceae bacterium SIJ1]|uniref:sensor histidine kinase n=1 Tax=Litoribacterium kuwaitense TaxID=1398745 RepID=UPI0013ED5D31|nr:sensor histidine kinase [Litoribacterium kuwaitense]NGP45425.1 sensor histidine kinase [Litoribacterium kuwaitense]
MVNNQNHVIVSKVKSDFNARDLQRLLDKGEGDVDEVTLKGKKYIKTSSKVEGYPLSVIHVVSMDQLINENEAVPSLIIWSFVISLVICVFVAYQFSRFVVKPIKRLQGLMKEVEDDNLGVRFPINGSNEIAQLGHGFNSMLERIEFLIEMVYIAQIKKKESELKALSAKINPHFLYNTLDTIYWVSLMENAPKSAKMVHALSRLFRMILKEDNEAITVEQELEYVQHYLNIQQVRYEDMIDFQLEIQEGVQPLKTIKMILQPLVENAISHGIEERGEGVIKIKLVQNEHDLVVSVEDNGVGADVDRLNKLLKKPNEKCVALKNINDRIQMEDGKGYGLFFQRNHEGGLTVVARQRKKV